MESVRPRLDFYPPAFQRRGPGGCRARAQRPRWSFPSASSPAQPTPATSRLGHAGFAGLDAHPESGPKLRPQPPPREGPSFFPTTLRGRGGRSPKAFSAQALTEPHAGPEQGTGRGAATRSSPARAGSPRVRAGRPGARVRRGGAAGAGPRPLTGCPRPRPPAFRGRRDNRSGGNGGGRGSPAPPPGRTAKASSRRPALLLSPPPGPRGGNGPPSARPPAGE